MAFWESGKRLGKARDLGLEAAGVRSLKGPGSRQCRLGSACLAQGAETPHSSRRGLLATYEYIDIAVYSVTSHYTRQTIIYTICR